LSAQERPHQIGRLAKLTCSQSGYLEHLQAETHQQGRLMPEAS
jgi:hypothetical protein